VNAIDLTSSALIAPAEEMALSLSLSERCADAGEHREALRHYRRYHQLYAQQMEQRLAAAGASGDRAQLDPVTQLVTRELLRQRLPDMVSRAHVGSLCLCVMRIGLDALQPARGLPSGLEPAVMGELGALLRANSRSKDLPALERELEMTLVLTDVELSVARSICERLRRAVAHHDWARLHPPLRVSLSIGLTALRGGEDATQLLTRADAGLTHARRDGGNCVRVGA
jgi:diguanylate cyclase (GGDEF)-like protein